jgi:hypothetical protein
MSPRWIDNDICLFWQAYTRDKGIGVFKFAIIRSKMPNDDIVSRSCRRNICYVRVVATTHVDRNSTPKMGNSRNLAHRRAHQPASWPFGEYQSVSLNMAFIFARLFMYLKCSIPNFTWKIKRDVSVTIFVNITCPLHASPANRGMDQVTNPRSVFFWNTLYRCPRWHYQRNPKVANRQ